VGVGERLMKNTSHFKRWLNAGYTQAFLAGIILSFSIHIVSWVDRTYFENVSDPDSNEMLLKVFLPFLIIFAVSILAIAILKKFGFEGFTRSETRRLHQMILKLFCFLGGIFFEIVILTLISIYLLT